MPPITPGAYLKLRRTAAGLSIVDVAALLSTMPATPEHLRAEQLELIEADAQPADFPTIVALRSIYAFDLEVLGRLEEIAQGHDLLPPRLCLVCGWGTVWDNLSWPIQHLCISCRKAMPPERIATWLDELAERAKAAA